MLKFSKTEVKHLAIAWAVISVAFAIVIGGAALTAGFLLMLFQSALTVGIGFIFHELGHKYIAQKYRLIAEFRADFRMLMFALIFSFAGFLFAAPGAVMIAGYVDRARNGKISAAGPLVNIALAVIFLAISFFVTGFFQSFALFGMQINAWLGLFNMIPFGNLDGRKILAWNKPVYFGMLIFSASLLFWNFFG